MAMHNSFGCRNSAPDSDRPNIVCIGDSITYGMPFGHIHAFPQVAGVQSQRRLNVINMGCPGFASTKLLDHWDKHQEQHAPSLFIVQVPYFDRYHDPKRPYADGVNDDTWLHGAMSQRSRFSSTELADLAELFLPQAIRHCEELLVRLRELACVHVMLYRYWSDVCPEFDSRRGRYWNAVRDLAEDLGLGMDDLGNMKQFAARGMAIKNECHFTKLGHQHVARLVLKACRHYGCLYST